MEAKKSLLKEAMEMQLTSQKVEIADAHCHLDLINDHNIVLDAIESGVKTIITNGIDPLSSKSAIKIASLNTGVYAAIGIDPEKALTLQSGLLHSITELKSLATKQNKVVAIGEIGLDYMKAKSNAEKEKQREVFMAMLDLAVELSLPVSVHSRESMDDILEILKSKSVKKAHLHFFEGNLQQAKDAERLGYMISIPPVNSTKRMEVIKDVSIGNLMAESDAPVVGATPKDAERSIAIVAAVKKIDFTTAASALRMNTNKFFGINEKQGFIRA